MAYWIWDSRSHRYRVTAEGAAATGQRAGTYVGQARMVALRDDLIAAQKNTVTDLAEQVANGEITLNQWILSMRGEIKDTFLSEYMLGHGGRNSMTPSDWGRLGAMILAQYKFLDGFASDIAAGKYTQAAVAARARMYMEAASQAFERGNALSRGLPDLPAYPGDGSTQCRANCHCRWEIREQETEWHCFWRLSTAEHCPDCVARAGQWNPLTVAKQRYATRAAVVEHLAELTESNHG